MNKNPHQKRKPSGTSREPSVPDFALALPPGCPPPQALALEGQEAETGVLAD